VFGNVLEVDCPESVVNIVAVKINLDAVDACIADAPWRGACYAFLSSLCVDLRQGGFTGFLFFAPIGIFQQVLQSRQRLGDDGDLI
jgi:hypothetical protein